MIDVEKYLPTSNDNPITLDFLDELVIPHERIPAYKNLMRFSVTALLWVDSGWQPDVRSAFVDVIEKYYDLFPEKLHKWDKTDSRQYQDIKDRNFVEFYRMMAEETESDDSFSGLIDENIQATQYSLSFVAREQEPEQKIRKFPLSYLRMHFPISWVIEDVEGFLKFILEVCEKLKPAHGMVGIAPVFAYGEDNQYPDYYYPFLKRFPGLDFVSGVWSVKVGIERKIRGVNWLTIIDSDYSKELAEQGNDFGELDDQIKMHSFNRGILVQAGLLPEIGDASKNIWPDHYCTVHKAMKPLLFDAYKSHYFYAPKSLDGLNETIAWSKRFD